MPKQAIKSSLRFLGVLSGAVSRYARNLNHRDAENAKKTQRRRCRRFNPLLLIPVLVLTQLGNSQTQNPTGVLRLRVRVKIGESTKGLARKRFYLLKGTLDQNKPVIDV